MEKKKTNHPRKRMMRDRLRGTRGRADVSKSERQFADQHPTPYDHSSNIVKPGTGSQATGQVTRS